MEHIYMKVFLSGTLGTITSNQSMSSDKKSSSGSNEAADPTDKTKKAAAETVFYTGWTGTCNKDEPWLAKIGPKREDALQRLQSMLGTTDLKQYMIVANDDDDDDKSQDHNMPYPHVLY